MLRSKQVVAALGLLGLSLSASAQSPSFKVIAHPSVSVDGLRLSEMSQIFMRKTDKWPDGTAALPVDQAVSSRVRAAFSEAVHQRSAAAVDAFWQKQIFSGRGLPPVTQASDAQVLAFVRANPGAVGY